eukprot:scpid13105/ scgid2673/ Leucine-rich repeat-containing protein 15; Leucine-rich repeat protein induced by beta-amyloid
MASYSSSTLAAALLACVLGLLSSPLDLCQAQPTVTHCVSPAAAAGLMDSCKTNRSSGADKTLAGVFGQTPSILPEDAKSLSFSGFTPGSLPANVFYPFSKLTKLDILNCTDGDLSLYDYVFNRNNLLSEINIVSCSLPSLTGQIFTGCVQLRKISFISTSTHTLPPELFHDATGLTDFVMSGSLMATLPIGLFDACPQLARITLTGNSRLMDLPQGLLSTHPRPSSVLVTTDETLIGPVPFVAYSLRACSRSTCTFGAGACYFKSYTATKNPPVQCCSNVNCPSCGPVHMPGGYMVYNRASLNVSLFQCRADYYSVGDAKATCMNSKWQHSSMSCVLQRTSCSSCHTRASCVHHNASHSTCQCVWPWHGDGIKCTEFKQECAQQSGDGNALSCDLSQIHFLPYSLPVGLPYVANSRVLHAAINQLTFKKYRAGLLNVATFSTYGNLTTLTIQDCLVGASGLSFPSKALRYNTELRSFHLSNCVVTTLPVDLFHFSPNLSSFTLNKTSTVELPDKLFAHTSLLSHLRIQSTLIHTLPAELLYSNTELQTMYIADNPISQPIVATLFSYTKKLSNFSLIGSRLNSIPTGLFDGAQNLRYVTLLNNALGMELPEGFLSSQPNVSRVVLKIDDTLKSFVPGVQYSALSCAQTDCKRNAGSCYVTKLAHLTKMGCCQNVQCPLCKPLSILGGYMQLHTSQPVAEVRCRSGYELNGSANAMCVGSTWTNKHGSCREIDECSDVALHNCSENAYCVNGIGSYQCHCQVGYDRNYTDCLWRPVSKVPVGGGTASFIGFGMAILLFVVLAYAIMGYVKGSNEAYARSLYSASYHEEKRASVKNFARRIGSFRHSNTTKTTSGDSYFQRNNHATLRNRMSWFDTNSVYTNNDTGEHRHAKQNYSLAAANSPVCNESTPVFPPAPGEPGGGDKLTTAAAAPKEEKAPVSTVTTVPMVHTAASAPVSVHMTPLAMATEESPQYHRAAPSLGHMRTRSRSQMSLLDAEKANEALKSFTDFSTMGDHDAKDALDIFSSFDHHFYSGKAEEKKKKEIPSSSSAPVLALLKSRMGTNKSRSKAKRKNELSSIISSPDLVYTTSKQLHNASPLSSAEKDSCALVAPEEGHMDVPSRPAKNIARVSPLAVSPQPCTSLASQPEQKDQGQQPQHDYGYQQQQSQNAQQQKQQQWLQQQRVTQDQSLSQKRDSLPQHQFTPRRRSSAQGLANDAFREDSGEIHDNFGGAELNQRARSSIDLTALQKAPPSTKRAQSPSASSLPRTPKSERLRHRTTSDASSMMSRRRQRTTSDASPMMSRRSKAAASSGHSRQVSMCVQCFLDVTMRLAVARSDATCEHYREQQFWNISEADILNGINSATKDKFFHKRTKSWSKTDRNRSLANKNKGSAGEQEQEQQQEQQCKKEKRQYVTYGQHGVCSGMLQFVTLFVKDVVLYYNISTSANEKHHVKARTKI